MVFEFHGNIQIFLIIFELILELFMKSKGPPELRGVFFSVSSTEIFFFPDFKNTVAKGTLTILGGKNNLSVIDTLTT